MIDDFFVCLFGVFLLIWRRHHWGWRTVNFDLCSALMAIGQWRFLLCHTYSETGHPFINVILGDPWDSNLLSSVQLELLLPVFMTYVSHGWDKNIQPSACGANALTHCTTATVLIIPAIVSNRSFSRSSTFSDNLKMLIVWFSQPL